MISIINDFIKQRLAIDKFNCDFKIISHLTDLYRFTGNNYASERYGILYGIDPIFPIPSHVGWYGIGQR